MKTSIALSASIVALVCSASASALPFTKGDIFAAIGSGQIAHYDHNGNLLETLNSGQGGYTTGMAFDAAGNLLSTNFSAGNITRYDSNGNIIAPNPFVSPGSEPESISMAQDGSFYVGRAGSTVQHYSATGTLLQTYTMPQNTDWQDLAANQTTLFFNNEGGTIQMWDVATDSSLGTFANNLLNGGTNSFALRILGNGDVLSAAGSLIDQYDPLGNFLGSYDVTGVDNFFALNLDPDGTHFWSGSFGTNSLYEFTIGGFGPNSDVSSFATGGQLFGVALAGEITAGGPGGAVPEPATWATMLLGFLGIGLAVRGRRKQRLISSPQLA